MSSMRASCPRWYGNFQNNHFEMITVLSYHFVRSICSLTSDIFRTKVRLHFNIISNLDANSIGFVYAYAKQSQSWLGVVGQPVVSEIRVNTVFQKLCTCGHSQIMCVKDPEFEQPRLHLSPSKLANL